MVLQVGHFAPALTVDRDAEAVHCFLTSYLIASERNEPIRP